MSIRGVSVFLACVLFTASTAPAQVFSNEFKLVPIAPPLPGGSGSGVAISGNTAVVGAPYSGDFSHGSAYVYVRTGSAWTLETTLVPDVPADSDHFGLHVAIDGDTILVSAQYSSQVPNDAGAVYVFERLNGVWSQTARLQAPVNFDGDDVTYFGVSVAIDGDRAVVGDHGNQEDAGRVLVFTRAGGVWDVDDPEIVTAMMPEGDSQFGESVAIDGDIIVVGAPGEEVLGQQAQGVVHIFKHAADGTWDPFGALITNQSNADDFFGASVAIDGQLILVGAPGQNDNSGAAYLFHQNDMGEWSSLPEFWTTLPHASAQADERYGSSVAKHGAYALVGARTRKDGKGAVYAFADLTGTGYGTLNEASDGMSDDAYGWSVSVDGTTAIVGAPFHGGNGAAYVYDIEKKLSFPRFNWVFTPWPYKYIYMGCPIWLLKDTAATIEIDRGAVPLRFSVALAPRNGQLRFVTDTTLEYRPSRGFAGSDVFIVRVTGPDGATIEKIVNVTVVER